MDKREPTGKNETLQLEYNPDEALRLDHQLCFKLYAASKEVVRLYKPVLDELDLTYTQYSAMLVLWEAGELSVRELGERLMLDSGTLSPLLKKLEAKGWINRRRSAADERVIVLGLTPHGRALKTQAAHVPLTVGGCIPLEPHEAIQLAGLLDKLLTGLA